MSRRMLGFVTTLIGGLAQAACGSGGASLGDGVPLPSGSVPLPRPAPKVSAAPAIPTWRHVPDPVSVQQFNQDKAECTKVANGAPGVGPPEIKFYLAFTNCMRSDGYEAISSL
jgi:hypothetical protein